MRILVILLTAVSIMHLPLVNRPIHHSDSEGFAKTTAWPLSVTEKMTLY